MELFKREGVVKGTTSPRELEGEEDRRVTSGSTGIVILAGIGSTDGRGPIPNGSGLRGE